MSVTVVVVILWGGFHPQFTLADEVDSTLLAMPRIAMNQVSPDPDEEDEPVEIDQPTYIEGYVPDNAYDYAGQTPCMFGSVVGYGLGALEVIEVLELRGAIPLAGGANVSRIAKHNRALPTHRVFFEYDHFSNALDYVGSTYFPPDVAVSKPLDHYTLGLERPFWQDTCSIELRVPLAGRTRFAGNGASLSGGNMGNIGVIFKHLVYRTNTCAAVVGVGVDAPTGSDVDMVGVDGSAHISNDAVHISPYVGMSLAPNSWLYFHGFLQFDINANGNHVEVFNWMGSIGDGYLNSPNFLMLDLGVGVWLLKNPDTAPVTGLAIDAEFHYTDALQDTDVFSINSHGVNSMFAGATRQNQDYSDLTLGIHAQCRSGTQLRAACVFPLQDQQRRLYDTGFQVSVIQPF